MKRLRLYHRRCGAAFVILFVIQNCLLRWANSIPYSFAYSMCILILIGVISLSLMIRVRRLVRRATDADLMLCPSCEYDLGGSATTVCPTCAAANPVAECASASFCRQCAAALSIPSEFKCPECGTAFEPQDVRDQWTLWLKQKRPLGGFFRSARPRSPSSDATRNGIPSADPKPFPTMKLVERDSHRVAMVSWILLVVLLGFIFWEITYSFEPSIDGLMVMLVLNVLIVAWLVMQLWRRGRRLYEANFLLCPSCECNLGGLVAGSCPKCAAVFDPQEVQDQWTRWLRQKSPARTIMRMARPRNRAV